MHKDKFVFAQLTRFLDRNHFNYLIKKKYEGDKYIKSYTCWNQLLTMMFGQFSNRESFRDLVVAMDAHIGKLYHLGIGKSVTWSNLRKANEQRSYRIFEEYATFMIVEARKRRINKIFEPDGHVYAFDSTTIDLCLSVFEWAKFRKHKGGIKLYILYDVEAEVPAFVHITPADIYDSKSIPEIPNESGAHYIFDSRYNDFCNFNTINISYYNILKSAGKDFPLYAIYVFDEDDNDWSDKWHFRMRDDGSIMIEDFYVASFAWNEESEKWENGMLETLYYNLSANKVSAGIHTVGEEPCCVRVENSSIIFDDVFSVCVFRADGALVYSGTTDCIAGLDKGIYIVRYDDKCKKVIIR